MTQDSTRGQNERTQALTDAGVAVWLDDLSRERLRSGSLEALTHTHNVVGVTTNPTIFAGALSEGDAYDDQLTELADVDVEQAVETITTDDVRRAADVLRPVYEATDGVDGRVSIEVDPRLAHDTDATVETAKRLWAVVDRPNIYIKIPATLEGLDAITQATAAGISVNVTLIFSLERYLAVMDAYAAGLEAARAAGVNLAPVASVASFFVSRVDGAIDPLLDEIGTPQAADLRGRTAIANARLAFAAFEQFTATPRWQELADSGARPQRPLWASTGVKDPSYPDTLYVDELVTRGVVNTMPEKTLQAVADHGSVPSESITTQYADARSVLAALAELGISLASVTTELEREGVEKFEKSWDELLETVRTGLRRNG